MLPVAVPAVLSVSIAIALAAKYFKQRLGGAITQTGIAIMLLLWSIQIAFIFADESNNAPALHIGAIDIVTGNGLTISQRNELGNGSPTITINHLLPENAKVFLLGEATPFYYQTQIQYQTTWDRGPLSAIMRAHPNQSGIWVLKLRELGFTHILINSAMIKRWEESHYNDPLINSANIDLLAKQLIVQHDWKNGLTLYSLN